MNSIILNFFLAKCLTGFLSGLLAGFLESFLGNLFVDFWMILTMDYELFPLKSRTFGLWQTNWADKCWGIFSQTISTYFGTVSSLSYICFPLFIHYFYKSLSLYIHIPNIYLGLGFEFEFGPQRIRNLAFV